MAVKFLHSISEILPEHFIETGGSRPVKVFCSDVNHYVCKYFSGVGPATSLFNEYIAAAFLKCWELPVPDFVFVQVKQEHLANAGVPLKNFDIPCYGSFFHSNCPEVEKFFLNLPTLRKGPERMLIDFLKIGLFDLWLSNEDRKFNNFNLLFNIKEARFIPIDHVLCFNGNNLDKEPFLISDDESILTSPLLFKLFSRPLQTKLPALRKKIEDNFTKDSKTCHENLDDILQQLPDEWQLKSNYLISRLEYLFSEKWKKECLDTFNRLFQSAQNHKL